MHSTCSVPGAADLRAAITALEAAVRRAVPPTERCAAAKRCALLGLLRLGLRPCGGSRCRGGGTFRQLVVDTSKVAAAVQEAGEKEPWVREQYRQPQYADPRRPRIDSLLADVADRSLLDFCQPPQGRNKGPSRVLLLVDHLAATHLLPADTTGGVANGSGGRERQRVEAVADAAGGGRRDGGAGQGCSSPQHMHGSLTVKRRNHSRSRSRSRSCRRNCSRSSSRSRSRGRKRHRSSSSSRGYNRGSKRCSSSRSRSHERGRNDNRSRSHKRGRNDSRSRSRSRSPFKPAPLELVLVQPWNKPSGTWELIGDAVFFSGLPPDCTDAELEALAGSAGAACTVLGSAGLCPAVLPKSATCNNRNRNNQSRGKWL
jgi:hypothetical protein